jgi:hypothetical protein
MVSVGYPDADRRYRCHRGRVVSRFGFTVPSSQPFRV